MTVYSNIEIRQAINDDIIVCQPFNPDHVAEASLDFTLGHYYYKQEFEGEYRVYNPFDAAYVAKYFKGPLKARSTMQRHFKTSHQTIRSSCCVLASGFWRTLTSLWAFAHRAAQRRC